MHCRSLDTRCLWPLIPCVIAMNLRRNIRDKLKNMPDKPGCYVMRDRRGQIIYVGKASSLRKRVRTYFRQATLRSAAPKLRGLIKSVYDLDYVVVRNEAEALLTEGRLIKDYRPRYNVSFKDDKRFLLLRADADQPFPMFKLCRIKRDDNGVYLGPYASSSSARAALDFVEKKFGLRKCTPRLPSSETHKHCVNDIVRYCCAPCLDKVTANEYHAHFQEACAFLRGECPQYLKELREEMATAAEKLDFERAAALRDTLLLLHAAVKQHARIASTPEMKRRESGEGLRELKKALSLSRLPHVIEAYDVSNISGTYSAASMVCFLDGVPQRQRYRHFKIKTIEGSDDPGMMAEVISRRFSRLIQEGAQPPGLVLVDGGITQLRAARTALARLGLSRVPVAGLAKRYEELYWHDKEGPIRLSRSSAALKMLQRLRDEAHRFALTYHRRLRSRRIRESALDEIPGIGAKRKESLLQHFGSARRLMKATEDQIAKVSGIGYEMAKVIKEHLRNTDK